MTRHRRSRLKLRSVYQWHRFTGAVLALFVVMLCVTGILLNHTTQLGLDKRFVKTGWLLDWYGIRAPHGVTGYAAGDHWISQWQTRLLSENADLGEYTDQLRGAVKYQDMLVVALRDAILLLTPEGEIIEYLADAQGVPTGIMAIGITSDSRFAIRTPQGGHVADTDLLEWYDAPVDSVRWSIPTALPESAYQRMLVHYRGHGLSMERVILDLHSGRLFGADGVYFIDLSALLLTFLALSGLWLWLIRLTKQRNHKKNVPVLLHKDD